jgi:hypothetical protein
MVTISRFIHGISLNSQEYLLAEDGSTALFETPTEAKKHLRSMGIDLDDEEMEDVFNFYTFNEE